MTLNKAVIQKLQTLHNLYSENMKLKNIITILLISILSLNSFAQQKIYLSKAVNIAGKQRMLGQRMAKNKVFLSNGQKTNYAKGELEKTISQFEEGIQLLKDFAPSPEIKHKVAIQEYAFKNYKKDIVDKSSKSLTSVIETNTLFLKICDDVVTELIKYSRNAPKDNLSKHENYVLEKIAEATGASGKLRYLTQRLTLYFALHEFKQKNVTPVELGEIVETMDMNLNYLNILEFNTLDIDDALSQVQYYWNQLKEKLYTHNGKINMNPKRINAVLMYDLCNTILEKANTATGMYADLNKS